MVYRIGGKREKRWASAVCMEQTTSRSLYVCKDADTSDRKCSSCERALSLSNRLVPIPAWTPSQKHLFRHLERRICRGQIRRQVQSSKRRRPLPAYAVVLTRRILISCEIPTQKLTIQSRIVNMVYATFWISTIKIFFKTLDKRVLMLYLCCDFEIILFTLKRNNQKWTKVLINRKQTKAENRIIKNKKIILANC